MQEALEHLYKNADYLSGPNDCASDRATGQYLRLMAEEIEEKYLHKERQQIEDAYEAGRRSISITTLVPFTASQFYTTTYGE